jgi:hypothetical protein
VVYSAENPSRATQIGRSDAHQYHAGRESAAGLPGHARLRPSRCLPATPSATPKHPALSARKKVKNISWPARILQRCPEFWRPYKDQQEGQKSRHPGKCRHLAERDGVERLIFRGSTKLNPRGRRPRLQPDATADETVSPPGARIPGDGAQQMNQLAEGRVGPTIEHSWTWRFVVGRAGGGGSITWSRRANPTTFRSSTKP